MAGWFSCHYGCHNAGLFDESVSHADLRFFSSLGYTHARYTTGMINNGSEDISLVGKRVEGVPDWLERAGVKN